MKFIIMEYYSHSILLQLLSSTLNKNYYYYDYD